MSTVCNLVCNPSKINSTTLNMVNYNYWAALRQSQIVIEDGMLIFNERIQGGSSYTHLQLVPEEFYNIIFVACHSNAIGGHLNAILYTSPYSSPLLLAQNVLLHQTNVCCLSWLHPCKHHKKKIL